MSIEDTEKINNYDILQEQKNYYKTEYEMMVIKYNDLKKALTKKDKEIKSLKHMLEEFNNGVNRNFR